MARRKRRRNYIFIILILVLAFGLLYYFNYYLPEKDKKTTDNKETKEVNNKTENDKTKEKENNNKENTTKEEKKEQIPEKSSSDENTENKNEVARRGGEVTLELIGSESVRVLKGETYVDEGVKATYSDGTDASAEVEVDNTVDTNKTGSYTVTYYAGNAVVIRRVEVK